MARPKIAILASGNGTTAEAFINAGLEGHIEAQVGLIICNNPKAGIFERIAALNTRNGLDIECIHISHRTHPARINEQLGPGDQTKAEEAAVLEKLLPGEYDAIVLMGFMKKIGTRLVKQFGWLSEYSSPFQASMLNTHAGLLPDTQGLFGIHKQEHVIANHLPYSGYTLHLVAEAYDEGPVIAEHKEAVPTDSTAESLLKRDMEIEKACLPGDIDLFIKNRQQYISSVEPDNGI